MRPGGLLKPTTVPHSSALKSAKGVSRGLTPSVRIALAAIRGYQILIRPLLTGSCRYLPTCSEYAITAVKQRGIAVGGVLAAWRILRCNPLCRGGYDPVPARGAHHCEEH